MGAGSAVGCRWGGECMIMNNQKCISKRLDIIEYVREMIEIVLFFDLTYDFS